MATDDLQGSDDISGRNGEESEQTLPQVSWRSTKLHVSRPVHTVYPTYPCQQWWKSTKYRALMMFCDSGDVKVRGSGVTTRSGCKWAADTSMAKEERVLKLQDIIGHVCLGRQRQHTLPTMWQGRPKAEERADSSRGPTPGGGEAYGKSQLS